MSISTTSAGLRVNAWSASSPRVGLLDHPALVLEGHLDGRADALVVFDGQDAGAHSWGQWCPIRARRVVLSGGFLGDGHRWWRV